MLKNIIISALFISTCVSAYSAISPIKQFMLDSGIVYTINVNNQGAVTTVMFPSAIQGIYGSNVVSEARGKGSYLLSYTPGNYYFSIKLIKRENGGEHGSLNIVFNRKVYVVNLKPTPRDMAYASVTFVSDSVSSASYSGGKAKTVPPEILLDAVDKARQYPLYAQQFPDVIAKVGYKSVNKLFRYKNYSVKLQTIYRFDSIDTLVFWVYLKNYSNKPITYDPQNISVRLGDEIYFTSFTDASGTIPAFGTTQAYFCITGRAGEGGRNNLSVDNNYVVLINADAGGINQLCEKDKMAVRKQQLIQQAQRLSERLNATTDKKKIDAIYKEYASVQAQFKALNNS
ncbi:MAG TPA: hypothetical protein QF753_08120 [Victivallales bacterium]|nr:hypothetical protein [Victivallales bacterium]|tara:strand:- start:146 stop:1174 length:1029 start_codon:yes stop_codon:yes gene_type:complete